MQNKILGGLEKLARNCDRDLAFALGQAVLPAIVLLALGVSYIFE